MKVELIDWELIKGVWKEHLWKDRRSVIEPVSALSYGGAIDMSLQSYKPIFIGGYHRNRLVGVNSVVMTGKHQARSRGLFVFPEYRGNGYGSQILSASVVSLTDTIKMIWTMPRYSALSTYTKSGYTQTSPWFTHGVEYGKHCFAAAYKMTGFDMRDTIQEIRTDRLKFFEDRIKKIPNRSENMDFVRSSMKPLSDYERNKYQ